VTGLPLAERRARKRRTAPEVRDLPLDPPELAPDVRVHPPTSEDQPWFLQRGTNHYYRLTADLARLVALLDGTRPVRAMPQRLGAPWTEEDIRRALAFLSDAELLRTASDAHRRRASGRLRLVPPLTVQLTLFDPSRMLAAAARVTRFAATGASVWTALAIIGAGLLALVISAGDLRAALGEPVPYLTAVAVVIGTLAATGLHELGHGLVLASYGGRPQRIGVMLFYLTPAFFCDVSDGWRLPSHRQRAHVALAGILVQGAIGGTLALAALLPLPRDVRLTLLLLAVVTLIACLVNTIPFVKLDGYIALMSWLDVTHLRDKAMADARSTLSHALFGTERERRLPQYGWAVPFGFACMLFPLFLVGNALLLWSDTLSRLGLVGSLATVAIVTVALSGLVREIARLFREARAQRAGALRRWTVGFAGIALVAGAAFVPVPHTIAGGFIVTDRGTEMMLPTSVDSQRLAPGTPVELKRGGLVLDERVGTAVVSETPAREASAPLSALFPVRETEPLIPVRAIGLREVDLVGAAPGIAVVDLGTQPLWLWLTSRAADAFTP
jgi:putative peptide zinc metalloprotease protein